MPGAEVEPRIANVSDELRGEKIDVIRYAPDSADVHLERAAPAKVLSVELFEDEGVALVTVPDHQLSLAIGREGQNVRLAARLTGWRLDITSDSEAAEARARYLAEREPDRPRNRPRKRGGGGATEADEGEPALTHRRRTAAQARRVQAGDVRELAWSARMCVGCRERSRRRHCGGSSGGRKAGRPTAGSVRTDAEPTSARPSAPSGRKEQAVPGVK